MPPDDVLEGPEAAQNLPVHSWFAFNHHRKITVEVWRVPMSLVATFPWERVIGAFSRAEFLSFSLVITMNRTLHGLQFHASRVGFSRDYGTSLPLETSFTRGFACAF